MTISNVWQRLTRPHPSITDIERRRQSQLLAAFLMVVMVAFSLIVIHGVMTAKPGEDNTSLYVLSSNILIVIVEYFLNRAGHYDLAARLFVFLGFFFVHVLALTTSFGSPSRAYYVLLILLISAILLSLRTTIILFLISIALQIGAAIFVPQTTTVDNTLPLFLSLAFGPVLLIFWMYRTGVERERQAALQAANNALRESEASLERRVSERTRDLEIAAEVSKQVTTILDLHKLLASLVERTRAAYDLYHVSIFLYDPTTENLAYEAGTGGAGAHMKQVGKHFNLHDAKGLVPLAARTEQVVLVNDVSLDANH